VLLQLGLESLHLLLDQLGEGGAGAWRAAITQARAEAQRT
jgi:hypothetical protein